MAIIAVRFSMPSFLSRLTMTRSLAAESSSRSVGTLSPVTSPVPSTARRHCRISASGLSAASPLQVVVRSRLASRKRSTIASLRVSSAEAGPGRAPRQSGRTRRMKARKVRGTIVVSCFPFRAVQGNDTILTGGDIRSGEMPPPQRPDSGRKLIRWMGQGPRAAMAALWDGVG